jgi:protein O-GlcNAc transferase
LVTAGTASGATVDRDDRKCGDVITNAADQPARQPRRNEPCSCGSGRRFKDCHGRLEAGPPGRADAKADARSALARGDREAAAQSARRATESTPRDPEAWNLLGLALEAGDPAAARAAWEQALALAPGDAEAHFRIGDFERRHGRHDAAIAAYRAALAMGSKHPVLLNNAGLSLRATGQLDEAARCFGQALEAAPDLAQAHANLGDVLREQHRFAAAIPCYVRALELEPGVAQLWINLGVCRHRAGLFGAAREAFERALAIRPDAPEALVNLAASLTAEARYAEALPLLKRALQARPADAHAQSTLLYVKQHTCDWDELDQAFARQRAALGGADPPVISPHNLLALPFAPAELRIAAERWTQQRVRAPVSLGPAEIARVDGRFRIGYVGSDFRSHALASLVTGVIEEHDRSRFEVYGYSFGPDDGSEERARFERAFDRFVDIRTESIETTVRRIRDDGVAVLLDTAGYVLNARSEIFASRPAPIQINAIGFPGTLGAPWYDYILSDAYVTPPGTEGGFTERILRLPHCYLPGDARRTMAPPPTRAQCGLPDGAFVFCCFNASYKILPEVFSIWMRLLDKVPGSVVWLLDTNAQATTNLRREAEVRGVVADRLVFAPRVPLAAHLARHALADLFLDTFPCNAHATANDALFAGLPIVTCSGETFASRVSGSQLQAVGLAELATDSLADYEALALDLARAPARLARCREHLRATHDTSPLFDSARYARALETLLVTALESKR